jgi:glutaredoxin 3
VAKVEIYTTTYCPYCVRAKGLLDRKGAKYTEINVEDDDARATMVERTGGARTVPQIFINDKLIGGSDDLHALDAKGGLDPLLG